MSEKFFVGLDLTGFEDNGLQQPVSRVTLKVDDESVVTAGDDSGQELTADCPHATQAMANAILARLKGRQYHMFSAGNAGIDPAAELGDGVTAAGVYSVISRLSDDGSGYAGISAPGKEELEDEYPSGGPMTQEFNRKIAETRASITKTAEQIKLEVANDLKGLSSSIDIRLTSITQLVEDKTDGLRSEFKISLDGISSRVSNAEGDITSLEQTAKSLRTSITNAQGDISALEQTANRLSTRISNVSGDVSSLEQTVDSFELSVSNGETSSTIKLMRDGVSVSSKTIRFTGTVTFDDLWGNQTIINGSTIDTDTLFLDSLYGDNIYLRDDRGRIGVTFMVTGASSADTACDIRARSLRIMASPGDIYFISAGGSSLQITDAIQAGGDLIPSASNRYDCGSRYFAWADVYSTDGTISSSDRAKKFDIDYDMSRYSALFDALRPCSFRRTDGNQFRAHTGLIAQDVEAARDAAGLPDSELAAFCSWEGGCGIRYEELIALLIYEVQNLKKQLRGEAV